MLENLKLQRGPALKKSKAREERGGLTRMAHEAGFRVYLLRVAARGGKGEMVAKARETRRREWLTWVKIDRKPRRGARTDERWRWIRNEGHHVCVESSEALEKH
jgi:hypothetical protein